MPIGVNQYQILSPEQANPLGYGLAQGIAMRLNSANAAAQEAKNPYVGPQAAADVKSTLLKNIYQNLVNQYTPEDYKTQFALRGANTGLAGQQANEIRYKLQHPGLMGGEEAKTLQSLMDMGLIDKNSINGQSNPPAPVQPQTTMSPQAPTPQQVQSLIPGLVNALQNPANTNLAAPGPGVINPQSPMAQMRGAAQGQSQTPQSSLAQNFASAMPEMPSGNGSSFDNMQPFQTKNPLVNAILNKPFANMAYQQQMVKGYNWAHLPVETKNQLIAQGYGMGVDPIRMTKYINEGKNIQEIAAAEGLDPENLPPPVYPPTAATKTRTQQVVQVGSELDYLSSASSPIIKRYADTFAGWSPERIKDMMSNDPEAQKRYGQYIGALSLQSGLANGRVVLEGGKPGYEVMKMVKEGALKGIDEHSPVKMTGLAYEEAQKTIDTILQKGAKIRTTTGMNPMSEVGKAHRDAEENSSSESSKKIVYVRNAEGKLVEQK